MWALYQQPDVPETFTLKELADAARECLGQAYAAKPKVSDGNTFPSSIQLTTNYLVTAVGK